MLGMGLGAGVDWLIGTGGRCGGPAVLSTCVLEV